MRGRVGGDARLGVGGVDGVVEDGALPDAHGPAPLSQHQVEEAEQRGHLLSQPIAGAGALIRGRQIEGVEAVVGRGRKAHHLAAHRLAHPRVLVLGVDDQAVHVPQQAAQEDELGEVALARPRLGEDHQVGILQARVEGVDDDRRVVVAGDTQQDALVHG